MSKKDQPVDGNSSIDPLTPAALEAEIEWSTKHEVVLLEQGMTEQMDRSPAPAVNFPDLLTRVGNDRELVRELFEMFKKEFPRLLQSLQESVASGDMKHVETTSHTLKGMLSNLSVTRAAAAAAQLEQIGREDKKSGLRDALTIFEREVAGLLSELDTYLPGAKA